MKNLFVRHDEDGSKKPNWYGVFWLKLTVGKINFIVIKYKRKHYISEFYEPVYENINKNHINSIIYYFRNLKNFLKNYKYAYSSNFYYIKLKENTVIEKCKNGISIKNFIIL
jgi:predicted RNA-binding protein (virulence factor B family)